MTQSWFKSVMVCPDCLAALTWEQDAAACTACEFRSEGHDFRPQRPRALSVTFSRAPPADAEETLQKILTRGPKVTYSGPNAFRDSRELMSAMSAVLEPGARVLDLGCGPKDQKGPVEHLGFAYVGVDYTSPRADLLTDAHSLPFRSGAFDCVLSYAVLEHLHNPVVAMLEVERVLATGGIYLGTVSLGEPFHQSYFHHTVWGLLSLLSMTKSLRLTQAWASTDTLRALSRMGRYSRAIRYLLRGVEALDRACPFLAPRKMRWPLKDKEIDLIHRAGSIAFVIQKCS